MIGATTRFGLTTWSAATDPLARAQFNADHQAIDAKAMIDSRGANLAARPAAPAAGTWWTADDTGTTYRYDGSTWRQVTTPAQPVSAVTPQALPWGQVGVVGTSTAAVCMDHVHAIPTHTAADHSTIPLSAFAAATAALSMGGYRITGLGSPSASTDLATKAYVDSLFP